MDAIYDEPLDVNVGVKGSVGVGFVVNCELEIVMGVELELELVVLCFLTTKVGVGYRTTGLVIKDKVKTGLTTGVAAERMKRRNVYGRFTEAI